LGISWVWWSLPVIPALHRLRQEDSGFQTSLGYIVDFVSNKTEAGDESQVLAFFSKDIPEIPRSCTSSRKCSNQNSFASNRHDHYHNKNKKGQMTADDD
jgi:hypothetical protein